MFAFGKHAIDSRTLLQKSPAFFRNAGDFFAALIDGFFVLVATKALPASTVFRGNYRFLASISRWNGFCIISKLKL